MEAMEFEGTTVEKAIEAAVHHFKVSRDRIDIEVISNGSPGFLGFIGTKKAQIRACAKRDPKEEKCARAQAFLQGMLKNAQIPADVSSRLTNNKIFLSISGDGTGLLIGKRGQTLDSIQFIVNKVVNREPEDRIPIIIDTENYRNRREAKLTTIAQRLGDRAKRQRVTVATEPLNPQERRVIYLALQNDPDIIAKSEGEGALKRVIIYPHKQRS
nr:protein jag [Deltaproteobacteria bacterium]